MNQPEKVNVSLDGDEVNVLLFTIEDMMETSRGNFDAFQASNPGLRFRHFEALKSIAFKLRTAEPRFELYNVVHNNFKIMKETP